jgi:hypothetical protein
MSISRMLPASVVAAVMAVSLGAATLSGQSQDGGVVSVSNPETSAIQTTPPAGKTLGTLARVKAEPMAANELDAVKGLHVHFVLVQSQNSQYGLTGLHLAGDVKTENNWENLGGTDPAPVAPSYHGLCKASAGPSPILIPFNPQVGTQCP